MVDVQTEIVINRAPRDVANFAANPDNAPLWYANIKSVEWKTPKPLAIGSQLAFVAHFLGRRLAYVYEVTVLLPEHEMVMRTANGPFPMETTYAWEATSTGTCRMTLRNRGNPSGFSRLLAPFMAVAMRRENAKDLRRLKAIMERA